MKKIGKTTTRSLQFKLTVLVGIILLIGNAVLVTLLHHSVMESLEGFTISLGGVDFEIYPMDDFAANIRLYGIGFALLMTVGGTMLTHYVLGRSLAPLKKLSDHMRQADHGDLTEITGLKSSATEIDVLIRSFNHMTARLKAAFDMQKDFSAYIAHEMRTPLAVMQTKIDVFRKKAPESDSCEELTQMVDQQVKRLNHLIGKILELADIQRVELKETVPVGLLFEELTEDLAPYAEASRVDIRLALPGPSAGADGGSGRSDGLGEPEITGLSVIGNHALLYQAFFNILENAVKYNRPGGRVCVSVSETAAQILVQVADNGSGIPDGEERRVFEPFFRSQNDRTRSKAGIGMGLAFSKRVFDHHQASVEAVRNPEGGVTFKVCLNK